MNKCRWLGHKWNPWELAWGKPYTKSKPYTKRKSVCREQLQSRSCSVCNYTEVKFLGVAQIIEENND